MAETYNLTQKNLKTAGFRPLHAGDDYDWRVNFTWPGSETLVGAKVWLTVKESYDDLDANAKLQLDSSDGDQIEILDSESILVKFRSSLNGKGAGKVTDDLYRAEPYYYDIQIKFASASKIVTVQDGEIEFAPNVTRASS